MKNILIITILFLFSLSSCNDWLDIKPESEIKEEELFSDEAGFRSALLGCYVQLGQEELYGSNLSMAFLDIMAQYYDNTVSPTNKYYGISQLDFTNYTAKYKLSSIWSNGYNVIANLNNLLSKLEEKGEDFFTDKRYYSIIKGEALALRAWIHFDLFRLFAPSPVASGMNVLAIPYVNKLTTVPFKQLTSQEIIDNCLKDMNEAKDLLYEVDPISPKFLKYNSGLSVNPSPDAYINDGGFLLGREERCNYVALLALYARMYLYIGNNTKANEYAERCIEINRSTAPTLFTFRLYSARLEEISDSYFSYDLNENSKLIVSEPRIDEIYETTLYGSVDTRINSYFDYYPGSNEKLLCKFRRTILSNPPSLKYLTLMTGEEIYLISAETTTNDSIRYARINKVRNYYGLSSTFNLNPETTLDFDDELFKEYRKRFVGDGVLFYYMKRKNFATIPGAEDVNTSDVFNFLGYLPNSEYEYGKIESEQK